MSTVKERRKIVLKLSNWKGEKVGEWQPLFSYVL